MSLPESGRLMLLLSMFWGGILNLRWSGGRKIGSASCHTVSPKVGIQLPNEAVANSAKDLRSYFGLRLASRNPNAASKKRATVKSLIVLCTSRQSCEGSCAGEIVARQNLISQGRVQRESCVFLTLGVCRKRK